MAPTANPNDPETLTLRVESRRVGDTVETVVTDNGVGIPEEYREAFFELGEQGERGNGDGLGLYLVSRLADVYGGDITLDEAPEGGARFVVELPAAE